jgi:cell division protein FtsW (lipid II flippase)
MSPARWISGLPWSIILLSAGLIVMGWLGIARSETLAESSGRFLTRQMVWSVLALVVMLLATTFNYRLLTRWSYVALGLSLGLLALVFFFPAVNGSHRWLRIGPVGFQPSEFAKLAAVLALARYLMYRENFRRLQGLLIPLAVMMAPVLLILREPDLGTSVVFLPVTMLMLFAAGARRRDLALVCLAGVLTMPVLWTQMSREQKSRVTAMFEDTSPGSRPSDDAYHLYQSKQMLAQGGWWGTSNHEEANADLGSLAVPAAHTDSILVVLGERYGLSGVAGLMLLYVLLIARSLAVAASTQEPFGRLVAVGVTALLGVPVVINAAMLVGLLPITGLSLPLVSYGGSGLIVQGLGLGLLLNISLRPGYELAKAPFRFEDQHEATSTSRAA